MQYVPRIPFGTKDFLPADAMRKRVLEQKLAGLFQCWGYEEVATPTFEFEETFSIGGQEKSRAQLFKFLDKDNRLLFLRSDMTTPIARLVASRMRNVEHAQRLFYVTNVFRHEQEQSGKSREFHQAGVEMLGVADVAADAEVIALAIASLREANLSQVYVNLGNVNFIHGLMEEYSLKEEDQEQIKQMLVSGNMVGLETILETCGVDEKIQALFLKVPLLHGGAEVLREARQIASNPVSRNALDNLEQIYAHLTDYGVHKQVRIDLGISRDFEYYTGMVFEAYTAGAGAPVGGGGRYDRLLEAFGTPRPATGFAIAVERVLLALARQGRQVPQTEKDVYVGWGEKCFAVALAEAQHMRSQGKLVVLGLQAENKVQSERSGQILGCLRTLYFGENP